MKVWFEIPTKSGVVRLEVPDLPASVGSDAAAEVRLKHPSVAPLHALLHESEDGVIISGVLPTHRLMHEGDEYRSLRLDDGDKMKIGEVPVLIRIEDDADDEVEDDNDETAIDDSESDADLVDEDSNDEDFDEGEDADDEAEDDVESVMPTGAGADINVRASGRRGVGVIALKDLSPDDYERRFLDNSDHSPNRFQDWLTPFERETVVSHYLIHRLCDWRLRGLITPEAEVPIPSGYGDTSAIPLVRCTVS